MFSSIRRGLPGLGKGLSRMAYNPGRKAMSYHTTSSVKQSNALLMTVGTIGFICTANAIEQAHYKWEEIKEERFMRLPPKERALINLTKRRLYPSACCDIMNEIPPEDRTDELYIYLFDNLPEFREYGLLPSHLITPERAFKMINEGCSIEKIPEKFITAELCEKAIKKYPFAIKEMIGMKCMGNEHYDMAFKLNHRTFKYIPYKFKTDEMCDIICKEGKVPIKYVPDKYLTQERCEMYNKAASEYTKYMDNFSQIPDKYMTKDMVNDFVKKSIKNGKNSWEINYILECIPERLITHEIVDSVISSLPENDYYIVAISSDKNKYEKAKVKWTKACSDMYESCYTSYQCYYSGILNEIPDKFVTEDVILKLIKKNKKIMYAIPDKYITKTIAEVMASNGFIGYFPDKFMNEDTAVLAVRYDPNDMCYVPFRYRTKKVFIACANGGTDHWLNYGGAKFIEDEEFDRLTYRHRRNSGNMEWITDWSNTYYKKRSHYE